MAGDSAPRPTGPASPAQGARIASPDGTGGVDGNAAAPAGGQGTAPPANAVSGNPAATNIIAGTGRLGEILGINRNGIRLGGLQINDATGNLAGGLGPGKWTGGTLTIADLSIDLEKFAGWKGALFGTEFLYFNGFGPGYSISNMVQGKNNPNALAGTVMGVNSLSAAPPFSRPELYELWFRQEFFDKKLIVRIGKSVPTYDFNNVVKAIPLFDQQGSIPAISSAIFTPLYVNPTMLTSIMASTTAIWPAASRPASTARVSTGTTFTWLKVEPTGGWAKRKSRGNLGRARGFKRENSKALMVSLLRGPMASTSSGRSGFITKTSR
jgi:porin